MRKLVLILATLALTLTASVAVTVAPVAAASPCIRFYEDAQETGDNFQRCSSTPSTLHDSNMTGDTVGLHGGCNGANWPLTNPDWNDCVTSLTISNLPGGWRVQLYVNSNYGFKNRCFDTNGTNSYTLGSIENDRTSSWRFESGNC